MGRYPLVADAKVSPHRTTPVLSFRSTIVEAVRKKKNGGISKPKGNSKTFYT